MRKLVVRLLFIDETVTDLNKGLTNSVELVPGISDDTNLIMLL